VHSFSLDQALIGPLAQIAPAGFLFLFDFFWQHQEEVVDIAFTRSGGLVPAIVQDDRNGDVLMLGFMNQEALEETQRTREVVFFSRSRNKLWKKGESSGHVLKVRELRVDCDADTLLIRVEPIGPGVCHEGYRSCFFRRIDPQGNAVITEERTFQPETVYGKDRAQ
jgi:phosphoribosyl-AMP cyclohydrolase